jgi:hypothetical protein
VPAISFLRRPPDEAPVVIGGGSARPEEASRVVLQTADGGVLVRAIRRQSDGSMIGEVYGVTPRQRSLGIGDLVSFEESHIFTFKPGESREKAAADAEVADMVRVFEAHFSGHDAPAETKAVALDSADMDFSFGPDVDTGRVETQMRAPAAVRGQDRPGAAATSAAGEPDEELTLDDAFALLRASERPAPAAEDKRPEPAVKPQPRAEPVAAPQPRVEPVAAPRKPRVEPVAAPRQERLEPARPPQPRVEPAAAPRQERVEPSPSPQSEPAAPAPTPSIAGMESATDAEAPAESHAAGEEHVVIGCLECGAPLTLPPRDDAAEARPSKVSCKHCGRINDVAQAEQVSRNRLRV